MKKLIKLGKRFFSIVLSVSMLIGSFPITGYAENTNCSFAVEEAADGLNSGNVKAYRTVTNENSTNDTSYKNNAKEQDIDSISGEDENTKSSDTENKIDNTVSVLPEGTNRKDGQNDAGENTEKPFSKETISKDNAFEELTADSQTSGSQTEDSQTEDSQTANSQTEDSQTEDNLAEDSLTEDILTEEDCQVVIEEKISKEDEDEAKDEDEALLTSPLAEIEFASPSYVDGDVTKGIDTETGSDGWTIESCTEYIFVESTASQAEWGRINETTWYVATANNLEITGGVVLKGDVNLILADGCNLVINGASYSNCPGINVNNNSLTIFGQSEGTGELHAIGGYHSAGIGGNNYVAGDNITINGGIIAADGGTYGAGIGGGNSKNGNNVTVNGGIVTANGGKDAAGIGGGINGSANNITINGGTVTTNGGYQGAGIGGGLLGNANEVIINEGTVNATGGSYAAGIGGGNTGTGNNVRINGGNVTAIGGAVASGIGKGYSGLAAANIFADSLLTVRIGQINISQMIISHEEDEDLASKLAGKRYVAIQYEEITEIEYLKPVYKDAEVATSGVASWKTATCSLYDKVTSSTAPVTLGMNGCESYFVVNGDISIEGQVKIAGDVHLIITDGSSLTVSNPGDWNAGILVSGANSLTVYGQSEGTGELNVTGGTEGAGIGGNSLAKVSSENNGNNITINNVIVNATGGYLGAGIGGGSNGDGNNIIINGGKVTAIGGADASGIGKGYFGSSKDIYIDSSLAIRLGTGTASKMVLVRDENKNNVGNIGNCRYVGVQQEIFSEVEYVKPVYKTLDVATSGVASWTTASSLLYDMVTSTSSSVTLGINGYESYYVVNGDVNIEGQVKIAGEVHLIIKDGSSLTVSNPGDGNAGIMVSGNTNSLTVYGQSEGTGKLIAYGGENAAGIGGNISSTGNNITINKVTVTATGGAFAAGIGGGNNGNGKNIIINGGKVTAIGVYAAGIGKGRGGSETGIYVDHSLTIRLGEGDTPEVVFLHQEGEDLSEKLNEKPYVHIQYEEISGITYLKPIYKAANVPTSGVASWTTASCDQYHEATSSNGNVIWGMTAYESYYVVSGDVNIKGQVRVYGNVNLIITDGSSLTISNPGDYNAGIQVSGTTNRLTVYGQTEGTGKLIVSGGVYGAGIGGNNNKNGENITINGATLDVTGGAYAAGIGGGNAAKGNNIIINGGNVTVTGGGSAAGIGNGFGGTAEDIYVDSSLTISMGSKTAPEMVLSHSGSEDLSGKINKKRFVNIKHSKAETVTYIKPEYKLSNVTTSGVASWTAASCSQYFEATSSTAALTWGMAGCDSWYVVKGEVSIEAQIKINGNVHIILTDEGSLTVSKLAEDNAGISVGGNGNSLTIYGQSQNTGKLQVTGGQYAAGIGGGNNGSGENVIINGGTVNANGGSYGAGIGGGIGGNGNNISVNGGNVTAIGGTGASGIGKGGFGGSTSVVYAESSLTVRIGGGTVPEIVLLHSENEELSGKINGKRYVSIKNEDIEPVSYGNPVYNDSADVTKGIEKWENASSSAYCLVASSAKASSLGMSGYESYFVVNGDVTINGQLKINGDVHLIIKDGSSLTVTNAGDANAGILVNGTNRLTIYGQSDNSGKLDVTGGWYAAGIGGNNTGIGENITINGGTVIAKGGSRGAGIGGGRNRNGINITINGGMVTATGGANGAGIGGGINGNASNITVNGGEVNAYAGSDNVPGIGGNSGSASGIIVSTSSVVRADDDKCPPRTRIPHNGEDLSSRITERYVRILRNSYIIDYESELVKFDIPVDYTDYLPGSSVTVAGESFVMPTFEGIEFCGWATDSKAKPDAEGLFANGDIFSINEDMVLHAIWKINTPETYLTFSSDEEFTIATDPYWDGIMLYSYDGENFEVWTGNILTATESDSKYNLYFAGINNHRVTAKFDENNRKKTTKWNIISPTNSGVECSGNIEALLHYASASDAEHPDRHPDMESHAFYEMFYCCSALTKAPELPIETLTDYCYYSMFDSCKSLKEAPELPAKTVAYNCCCYMFYDCTALTKAPDILPAEELAKYCYYYMFYNCASLSTAPKLPAESLTDYCYCGMFCECTSLTKATELPAKVLSEGCYYDMFYDCSSLKEAPELPAETLATYCYYEMFYGCTSLKVAPELSATKLAVDCYYAMFSGCTSLRVAPELPATTIGYDSYGNMFYGCTALRTAPKLPATTLSDYSYCNMFNGCTSLTKAPALPAQTMAYKCYSNMFYGCTALERAPKLSATTLAEKCYDNMFYGCENLNITATGSEEDRIVICTSSDVYQPYHGMFYGCNIDSSIIYENGTPLTGTTYYMVATLNEVIPVALPEIEDLQYTGSYQRASISDCDEYVVVENDEHLLPGEYEVKLRIEEGYKWDEEALENSKDAVLRYWIIGDNTILYRNENARIALILRRNEKAPAATLSTISETEMKSLLTTEEKLAYENGEDLTVKYVLDVKGLEPSEVNQSAKRLFDRKKLVMKLTEGAYMDMELTKEIRHKKPNGTVTTDTLKVSETPVKISATYAVPEQLLLTDRKFYVSRVYGRTEEIIISEATGSEIEIGTDKFSSFALMYGKNSNNPAPYVPSGKSSSGGGGGSGSVKFTAIATGSQEMNGSWECLGYNQWIFNKADGTGRLTGWGQKPYTNAYGVTETYWYHFGADGVMTYGWFYDEPNLAWYYLSETNDGFFGHMVTGWYQDTQDGRWYYLDETGRMLVGEQVIDGKTYYLNPVAPTQSWFRDAAGNWVYTEQNARTLGSLYIDEETPNGWRAGVSGSKD